MPHDTHTPPITHLLLIIDAETLLSHTPQPSLDPRHPTPVEAGFIFNAGPQKRSSPMLMVRGAGPVHLRARTVGLYAEHSVVLYHLAVGDAGVLTSPHLEAHTHLNLPVPNPDAPTEPLTGLSNDHYWHCQAVKAGVERCELSFMLVNSDCEALGYFGWEVGVRVSG